MHRPAQRVLGPAGEGAELGTLAAGRRDPLALHRLRGAGHLHGGYDGEEPEDEQRRAEPGLREEAHPHPLPHVHLP